MTEQKDDERDLKAEYEYARTQFEDDTSEIRREIRTFAMAIIVATWILVDSNIASLAWAKATFFLSVATIAFGLAGKVCRAYHWERVIGDSRLSLDRSSTFFGMGAHYLAVLSRIGMVLAVLSFVATIFS